MELDTGFKFDADFVFDPESVCDVAFMFDVGLISAVGFIFAVGPQILPLGSHLTDGFTLSPLRNWSWDYGRNWQ